MSIYVGGEKAKLYRGDYGPAQFYKGDVKIAGYTDVEKVGAQISGVDTYNDQLLPTIEGKSEQTVTANSPSPDHPEPIRSSENFDVVSCGRNLFDPNSAVEGPVGTTYEKYGNGFRVTSGPVSPCAITTKMTLSPHTSYSFSCIGKPTIGTTGGVIAVFVNGGWLISSGAPARRITFSTAENGAVLLSFYSNTYPKGVEGDQAIFEDIQLEFGATATPYEPYHATTAHITDPLRSVGDVSDSIEVSEGKVEVVRRVVRVVNSASVEWAYHSGYSKNGFNCWILRVYKALAYDGNKPVMCSMLKMTSSIWDKNETGITHQEAISNGDALLWVKLDAAKFPDTASLLAKEFYIDYAPNLPPTRTDITATPLGQALLALRTVPHYTQVYTNATLPPMMRAKIKEMEA